MAAEEFKRKLTAIFSADAVGYSRLMGEDEAATVKTLETLKQVMYTLIKQHRGRVIDSPGDNLLAEFASVVDAVQCGVAVQNELLARNAVLPENRRMQFRIGINLGDVIEEGEKIYGDGVNIAARLESLADPGGICLSKTAFDQIETKLPLGYRYIGEQTVKNIAKAVGAYKVLMEPRVVMEDDVKKGTKPRAQGARGRRTTIGLLAVVVVLIGALALWHFALRPPHPPAEKADPKKVESQLLAQLEAQKQATEKAQRAAEDARREAHLQAQKQAADETLRRAQEERIRIDQDRKKIESEKRALEAAKQQAAAAQAVSASYDGTYSGQLCYPVPNKPPYCWSVDLVVRNGVAEGNWVSPAQKTATAHGTVAADGSVQLNLETWSREGTPVKATMMGRIVEGTITASGQWSTGGSVTGNWKRKQVAVAAQAVSASYDGAYSGQLCNQWTKPLFCWPVALVVRNGVAQGSWLNPAQKTATAHGTVAADGSVHLNLEAWDREGNPVKATMMGRIVEGAITASGQWSTGGSVTGNWKRKP